MGKKVILCELDYKGHYARFALTKKEFQDMFCKSPSGYGDRVYYPSELGDSFTISPLVHLWCAESSVGSNLWYKFFDNMGWGLPSSEDCAYIDYDRMPTFCEVVRKERLC